jgi:glycosyltransferase involved in cell wall biosynthesis
MPGWEDRSVRLVLVAPLLGGAGRVPDVFETLGPLLGEAGHEVVLTSTRPGRLARALDQARTVWATRRGSDVVVLHLYSGRAFRVAGALTRLVGRRRLVGVLSGGGFPTDAERHPRRVRRVLGRFDDLVAPSEYLGDWARSQVELPVTVIPNPLDLAGYPWRRRATPRPRLLWLRAYHPIYAPEVAVRAMALLADVADLHLHMAGDDKGERAAVQALVEELGVGDRVTVGCFAGPDEKQALFEDHDVFLNSSRVDNRPVSVVEAAACGLCVVSTDVGGVPDLVRDGESAVLVPPDDPEALAAAVRRVLADPELAGRLSDGGREVAERGRPEVVLAAWADLLSSPTTPGTRRR